MFALYSSSNKDNFHYTCFAQPWSPARKGNQQTEMISGFQSKEMFKGLEMSCNTLAVTYPFQNEVWKQVVRVPPTGSPVYVVEYISSAKCQIIYLQIGVIMNNGNISWDQNCLPCFLEDEKGLQYMVEALFCTISFWQRLVSIKKGFVGPCGTCIDVQFHWAEMMVKVSLQRIDITRDIQHVCDKKLTVWPTLWPTSTSLQFYWFTYVSVSVFRETIWSFVYRYIYIDW